MSKNKKIVLARYLIAEGFSTQEVAGFLGVKRSTFYRWIDEEKKKGGILTPIKAEKKVALQFFKRKIKEDFAKFIKSPQRENNTIKELRTLYELVDYLEASPNYPCIVKVFSNFINYLKTEEFGISVETRVLIIKYIMFYLESITSASVFNKDYSHLLRDAEFYDMFGKQTEAGPDKFFSIND